MSEKERLRTIKRMEIYEAKMKAKGIRPSKTWRAMKRNVGNIIIRDASILD